MKTQKNIILELTFEFALAIIEYVEILEEKRKYVIANQVMKSGTAIGALVREAQNAESRADFIHKFKISAKEAEETEYWLLLCTAAKRYPYPDGLLMNHLEKIKRILGKIILSSKGLGR